MDFALKVTIELRLKNKNNKKTISERVSKCLT